MAPTEYLPEDKTESFLSLLMEHERALGIYVTGLVGSPQDAQDILQEGKIVMWRNFESFELGTNFLAWSRKILFYQVLSWRKRVKKNPKLLLDEEPMGLLDETIESAQRERRWQAREEALCQCLEKLKEEHREILQMRYREEASIERIASKTGKTEGAVYRLISRLRKSLYECIETDVAGEPSTGGAV